MFPKRVAAAALLTLAVVALPVSQASARRHHDWFPLFWPFAAAAAVVGTAAAVATAPIAAITAPAYYPPYSQPYPYYGGSYPAPAYGYPPPPLPAYYGYPGYYGPR